MLRQLRQRRDKIVLLALVAASLALVSCGSKTDSKSEFSIAEIEGQTKMSFPEKIRILAASDGGGRLTDYYEWTFFSEASSRITMPYKHDVNGDYYTTNSTDAGIRMIEIAASVRIKNPLVTFSSNWETDTYEFQGTVVRTPDGDYLHLKRFSKQN